MATGRVPTTANSPLTTKGDLFTYSTTQARLAAGSNGDTLVADSAASTGLRWQASQAAGKNYIINGGMDIWQRGTSIAGTTGNPYTTDRWSIYRQGVAGSTVSRQTTSDTTNLPNIQYCARVQRDSGNTSTNIVQFCQPLESVNSIPLAGQAVVLSFWARKGANFSQASSELTAVLNSGTGTDQNPVISYTGAAYPINSAVTLTTTWQRFTLTGTIATTATELGMVFQYTPPAGTAGAADYFEITGIQLEVGSRATSFTRAGGTLQGELAACQRYYYVLADGNTQSFGTCAYFTATDVLGTVFYPVTMRTAPTFAAASGSFYEVLRNGAADGLTGLQGNFLTTRTANIFADTGNGASGTAGHGGQYRTSSASANIAFSAEL